MSWLRLRAMQRCGGTQPVRTGGQQPRQDCNSRSPDRPGLPDIGRVLAAMCLLLAATGGSPAPHEAEHETVMSGPTMGTTYTVKLAAVPDDAARAELQTQIDALLEGVNARMSTYRPDSEISRFNRYERTDWFEVSEETAAVVAEALRISALSDGAFDVTVAPLVNLWSFGPEPGNDRVPSDAEIAAAQADVGYRHLSVRRSPPALRKDDPRLSIDLSAIAKGFAVDRVADLLQLEGIAGYWVEIGGEIRSGGRKADGSGWRAGIESPRAHERSVSPGHVFELADRAVATSGDYRNFFERDGRRYSHTIDPRTGAPVEHELASATVVADNCMFADAAATALMVLGPDRGYDWATSQGLAALLIVREGDGFVDKATPQFRELIGPRRFNTTAVMVTAAVVLFALAIFAMAIGVVISNRRLRGTCGGLAGWKDDEGRPMCFACESPSESCAGPENRPAVENSTPSNRLPGHAVDETGEGTREP